MAKDTTNLDQEWLDTLSGVKVTGMDKKWRLHARLVRVAFQKRADQLAKNLPQSHSRVYQRIVKSLEEEGYFKKPSPSLSELFSGKMKWLVALLVGASVVYATKELLHFTEPQVAKPTKTIDIERPIKPEIHDPTGFWRTWFGPSGGFRGMGLGGPYNKPLETTHSSCSPEQLSFEGCLELANSYNAEARFNLGLMYEQGLNGVTQDYQQALVWYKKSAALGNAQASFNMDYLIEKKLVGY